MKEHIIRANLYQNGQVEWEDAEHSSHFNVHQKTRQFLEAKLKDFLLGDGEVLLAAFEKVEEGETNHENPDLMHKVADAENGAFYRIQIPSLVHNTPGAWNVQFFLATDYDKLTGGYSICYPFGELTFVEYSSIMDDGLTVPSVGELKEMCDRYADVAEELKTVDQSAKSAEAAACSAGASAAEAQAYAKQLEDAVYTAYQNFESKADERYVSQTEAAEMYLPVEKADETYLKKATPPSPLGYAAVYAIDRQGNDITVSYSPQVSSWTMAQRGTGGTLFIGVPTHDNHATTKSYVVNLPDNIADETIKAKWAEWLGVKKYYTHALIFHKSGLLSFTVDRITSEPTAYLNCTTPMADNLFCTNSKSIVLNGITDISGVKSGVGTLMATMTPYDDENGENSGVKLSGVWINYATGEVSQVSNFEVPFEQDVVTEL